MNSSTWHHNVGKLAWYGGIYILTCGVLFTFWILFFVTANVPPLWQQVLGCILLPFGLLIKIPANTYIGITICMLLNTVFWAVFPLIVEKYIARTRQ